jgi:hypothetical protein
MSINEIQEVKSRIDAIDRETNALQAERFTAMLRLSALLARHAKDNPPVELEKRQPTWYDSAFGGSGFENSPRGGSR